MDSDAIEGFLESEIAMRMMTSSWRKLDACFKWQKLKEFMLAKGAMTDDPKAYHVKELLSKGKLNQCVEYDQNEQRILRLNLDTDAVCEMLDSDPFIHKGG
jgi:polyhydroxyalkanoate synthesis regulator phasin